MNVDDQKTAFKWIDFDQKDAKTDRLNILNLMLIDIGFKSNIHHIITIIICSLLLPFSSASSSADK